MPVLFDLVKDEHGDIDLSLSMAFYERVCSAQGEKFEVFLNEQAQFYQRLDGLFNGVSPDNRFILNTISDDRANATGEFEKEVKGKNLNWLELGPWSAFLDSRVTELTSYYGLNAFIRFDIDDEFKPELVGDAAHLPFIPGTIDVVSSNSVLEHIHNTEEVLKSCFSALADGGYFKATMPFMFIEHGYPSDYVRLTPNYFVARAKELGFVVEHLHTKDFSGCYYVIHNLLKSNPAPNPLALEIKVNNLVNLFVSSMYELYTDSCSSQYYVSVEVMLRKPGKLISRRCVNPSRRLADKEYLMSLLADK